MLHWKKIKNSVKDTARKAKMAKWQDIEEMRHWVLGEPSSEFEKQMYDMAVVIVEEIIDRAQTKIRKSKRRRATQYSFKRVPSADLYSHDSRENLIEEQKSFAGASELAIPSFTSFSHYDGATAIFKDSTGSKSALNSPSLRKLPVIPGTPREMKMIRFEIRRYLPKTKEPPRLTDKISTIAQYGSACVPLSGVLRKSYEDPRVDVPVKLPVFVRPASKSTDGILDESVLNVFSDESREKQEEGKRFGVGVFVLDAQTHRKSLREFMLYNQLLGKRCQRNRNLGAHLSSLMEARTLLEDQQPGNVPKKVRRQRPTFTFSDKESKGHPEGYEGYKHGQVTLLQSRPKKTTTDPKKPQKKSSETKRGIGIKTIIADKLFNPGDKHGRPVRGYRVWPLKPEKKRTPLSALVSRHELC